MEDFCSSSRLYRDTYNNAAAPGVSYHIISHQTSLLLLNPSPKSFLNLAFARPSSTFVFRHVQSSANSHIRHLNASSTPTPTVGRSPFHHAISLRRKRSSVCAEYGKQRWPRTVPAGISSSGCSSPSGLIRRREAAERNSAVRSGDIVGRVVGDGEGENVRASSEIMRLQRAVRVLWERSSCRGSSLSCSPGC
jgi:hypothetical protein